MNKQFWIACAIGLALVGVVVTGIVIKQRGARIGITGNIIKVRTAPLDESSSVVVLDFRINNPSNVLFQVRSVSIIMEDKDGQKYDGQTVAEMDAKRLFDAIPLLGQKFTETLVERNRIVPHSTEDRMVAARFNAPESRLEGRKRFLIQIEEVDGSVSEISER